MFQERVWGLKKKRGGGGAGAGGQGAGCFGPPLAHGSRWGSGPVIEKLKTQSRVTSVWRNAE